MQLLSPKAVFDSTSLNSMFVTRLGIYLAYISQGLGYAVWVAIAPSLQKTHGMSDTQLGLILFAFGLGNVVLCYQIGVLTRTIGSFGVLCIGALLLSELSLISIASNNLFLSFIVFLGGIISTAVETGLTVKASDYETKLGKSAFCGFHAFWGVGAIIGSAIFARCLEHGLSWQLAYGCINTVSAIGMALGGLIAHMDVPNVPICGVEMSQIDPNGVLGSHRMGPEGLETTQNVPKCPHTPKMSQNRVPNPKMSQNEPIDGSIDGSNLPSTENVDTFVLGHFETPEGVDGGSTPLQTPPNPSLYPLWSHQFILLVLLSGCSLFVEAVFSSWGSLYSIRHLGSNIVNSPVFYTVLVGAMTPAMFVGDYLVDIFGSRAVYAGGMLLAGGCGLVMTVFPSHSPILKYVCAGGVGVGVGNNLPLIQSIVGQMDRPPVRLSVLSAVNSAILLGGGAVVGPLADWVGLRCAIGFVSLIGVLSAFGAPMMVEATEPSFMDVGDVVVGEDCVVGVGGSDGAMEEVESVELDEVETAATVTPLFKRPFDYLVNTMTYLQFKTPHVYDQVIDQVREEVGVDEVSDISIDIMQARRGSVQSVV